MQKAIEICEKQLSDANSQTVGFLRTKSLEEWMSLVRVACGRPLSPHEEEEWIRRFQLFDSDDTSDSHDEGSFLIRTIEWCITRMQHAWYIKVYGHSVRSDGAQPSLSRSHRPTLPTSGLLSSMKYPRLPFILPFHTVSSPFGSWTWSILFCSLHCLSHHERYDSLLTGTPSMHSLPPQLTPAERPLYIRRRRRLYMEGST